MQNIVSGEEGSVNWKDLEAGEHGWYVRTTGPYGGVQFTEVRTFTIDGKSTGGDGDGDGDGDNGGGDGDGDNGDGDGDNGGGDGDNGGGDGGNGGGGNDNGNGNGDDGGNADGNGPSDDDLATTGASAQWTALLGLAGAMMLALGSILFLRRRRA